MKAHIRIVLHELPCNFTKLEKTEIQRARVRWISHNKSQIIFVWISILYGISS